MGESGRDVWAEWLLRRRCGGDPVDLQRQMADLQGWRDRVLDHAALTEGETLLDVGTGDGLIAFAALDRVGAGGSVVFSDVSQDLLDHARGLATGLGVLHRCRFVQASADDLAPIPDASVDVVTTRSVLIYVADKQQAFAELFRVLRPGGRISLFEPINRFGEDPSPDRLWGYDVAPVRDLAAKVRAIYRRCQPPETDPMRNFDERDLLAHAERAGFAERHLQLRIDIEPHPPRPWQIFANTAFNPRIPTLTEAMAEALDPPEVDRFVSHLRPIVERGGGTWPVALAYLWAAKS